MVGNIDGIDPWVLVAIFLAAMLWNHLLRGRPGR